MIDCPPTTPKEARVADTTVPPDLDQIEAALMHALRQASFWAARAEALSIAYAETVGVSG